MRDGWTRARLGVRVSRLGLAPSYGVAARSVDEAFERGVDFFFWGAIRRWGFGLALRKLVRRHPGRVVVAIQSFTDSAFWLARSVDVARARLGVDAIDLLCLAYRNTALDARVWEAALELRARGRVRALMVSSHDRPVLVSLTGRDGLDAIMARYSAAHRGAEAAVFPAAVTAGKGVLAYTATRWGSLLDPAAIPAGERPPRASDCYRFALSHDAIDACLIGPASQAELREALVALERGPMTQEERAWMIRVGDGVRAHRRAAPPLGVADYVRQAPSMAVSLLRRGVTEDLMSRFNR
jgi:predicted aldo/keto reductase-like oxidoreductase